MGEGGSGDDSKIILGPGRDRWPGTPHNGVEKHPQEVAPSTRVKPDESSRAGKRRNLLRLKVISAVQMAALQFSEDEIRQMVEQAFNNTRNRNDYS